MKNKNAELADSMAVLVLLFIALAVMLALPFFPGIRASFYDLNASVITRVNVSNAAPTVSQVHIWDNGTITGQSHIVLNEGTVHTVYCNGSARDTNGWEDINKSNGTIFLNGYYTGAQDNDFRYYNRSCAMQQNGTDINSVLITCKFLVFFHADAGNWNCSILVHDNVSVEASAFVDSARNISQLFALELNTSVIDYGTLNVSQSSGEIAVNIKNTGNADINISVDGYGDVDGDGQAMNCSGQTSIGVGYERYAEEPGKGSILLLTNLTDTALSTGIENLTIVETDDDNANSTNNTYWMIEVPKGVQTGPCNGTVIFSAVA